MQNYVLLLATCFVVNTAKGATKMSTKPLNQTHNHPMSPNFYMCSVSCKIIYPF